MSVALDNMFGALMALLIIGVIGVVIFQLIDFGGEELVSGCEMAAAKAEYGETRCALFCGDLGEEWSEVDEVCPVGEVCCAMESEALPSNIVAEVKLGTVPLVPGSNTASLDAFRDNLRVSCISEGATYRLNVEYEGFVSQRVRTWDQDRGCVGEYEFALTNDRRDLLVGDEGVVTVTIDMFNFDGPVAFDGGGDQRSTRATYRVTVS